MSGPGPHNGSEWQSSRRSPSEPRAFRTAQHETDCAGIADSGGRASSAENSEYSAKRVHAQNSPCHALLIADGTSAGAEQLSAIRSGSCRQPRLRARFSRLSAGADGTGRGGDVRRRALKWGDQTRRRCDRIRQGSPGEWPTPTPSESPRARSGCERELPNSSVRCTVA